MSTGRLSSLATTQSVARGLRYAFVGLLVLTVLSASYSFLTYEPVAAAETVDSPGTATDAPASPTNEPRVVSVIDGVGPGQLTAYDSNGSVVYHNESWWIYHDVDPSPVGKHTVTYVASGIAEPDTCPGEKCMLNTIERVNLTTDEVTTLHSWSDARNGSTQTHDVDRINESVFLVADISYPDRVYMVNVTSGEIIWQWRVSEAYEPSSGGDYPSDWSHLNDAEYLPDGRVMVSLRNQDSVVFIEPGSGLQESWTLGEDGKHEILYEAHNPDYIPEARGGPAVVIADSENNRLVEYQRVDGEWERSWHWQDVTLQWPRDADRLPSGRTLVADSHGKRILSVRPDGSIAWAKQFPTGSYDVEVLGTGDESAGGESAARLDLTSRRLGMAFDDGNTSMAATSVGPSVADGRTAGGNESTPTDTRRANATNSPTQPLGSGFNVVVGGIVSLVPPLVLHGLLFALPSWAGAIDAVLLLATTLVGVGWVVVAVGDRVRTRWASNDAE